MTNPVFRPHSFLVAHLSNKELFYRLAFWFATFSVVFHSVLAWFAFLIPSALIFLLFVGEVFISFASWLGVISLAARFQPHLFLAYTIIQGIYFFFLSIGSVMLLVGVILLPAPSRYAVFVMWILNIIPLVLTALTLLVSMYVVIWPPKSHKSKNRMTWSEGIGLKASIEQLRRQLAAHNEGQSYGTSDAELKSSSSASVVKVYASELSWSRRLFFGLTGHFGWVITSVEEGIMLDPILPTVLFTLELLLGASGVGLAVGIFILWLVSSSGPYLAFIAMVMSTLFVCSSNITARRCCKSYDNAIQRGTRISWKNLWNYYGIFSIPFEFLQLVGMLISLSSLTEIIFASDSSDMSSSSTNGGGSSSSSDFEVGLLSAPLWVLSQVLAIVSEATLLQFGLLGGSFSLYVLYWVKLIALTLICVAVAVMKYGFYWGRSLPYFFSSALGGICLIVFAFLFEGLTCKPSTLEASALGLPAAICWEGIHLVVFLTSVIALWLYGPIFIVGMSSTHTWKQPEVITYTQRSTVFLNLLKIAIVMVRTFFPASPLSDVVTLICLFTMLMYHAVAAPSNIHQVNWWRNISFLAVFWLAVVVSSWPPLEESLVAVLALGRVFIVLLVWAVLFVVGIIGHALIFSPSGLPKFLAWQDKQIRGIASLLPQAQPLIAASDPVRRTLRQNNSHRRVSIRTPEEEEEDAKAEAETSEEVADAGDTADTCETHNGSSTCSAQTLEETEEKDATDTVEAKESEAETDSTGEMPEPVQEMSAELVEDEAVSSALVFLLGFFLGPWFWSGGLKYAYSIHLSARRWAWASLISFHVTFHLVLMPLVVLFVLQYVLGIYHEYMDGSPLPRPVIDILPDSVL
jgi:hypothetical protein